MNSKLLENKKYINMIYNSTYMQMEKVNFLKIYNSRKNKF